MLCLWIRLPQVEEMLNQKLFDLLYEEEMDFKGWHPLDSSKSLILSTSVTFASHSDQQLLRSLDVFK